jgi:adenine deaminase
MATIGARLPSGGRAGVSKLPREREVDVVLALARLINYYGLLTASCRVASTINLAMFRLLANGHFPRCRLYRLRAYVKLSRGSRKCGLQSPCQ